MQEGNAKDSNTLLAHECPNLMILMSYNSDAVYLYSMYDEAHDDFETKSAVLPSNSRKRKASSSLDDMSEQTSSSEEALSSSTEEGGSSIGDDLDNLLRHLGASTRAMNENEEETSEDEDLADIHLSRKFQAPVVLPRRRFAGACNVETIKDVNFVGSEDEYVASGSDDGKFFLWEKSTGRLHGIYEGDGSVVNVIESHPRLPLLAVSGIDTTVKLFAPSRGESEFSRLGNAANIVEANGRRGSNRQYFSLSSVIHQYQAAVRATAGDDAADQQCTFQ